MHACWRRWANSTPAHIARFAPPRASALALRRCIRVEVEAGQARRTLCVCRAVPNLGARLPPASQTPHRCGACASFSCGASRRRAQGRVRRKRCARRQRAVRGDHRSPSGVVFAVSDYADSWSAVRLPDRRINLYLPELLPELEKLAAGLPEHPTSYRLCFPPASGAAIRATPRCGCELASQGNLRHPAHKSARRCRARLPRRRLGEADHGAWQRRCTGRDHGRTAAETRLTAQWSGHRLPPCDGSLDRRGVAINELTSAEDRDPIAGTPWHKRVQVRLQRVDVALV